jgi:hypothetical protein
MNLPSMIDALDAIVTAPKQGKPRARRAANRLQFAPHRRAVLAYFDLGAGNRPRIG